MHNKPLYLLWGTTNAIPDAVEETAMCKMGHETWKRGEGGQQALPQKQHPSCDSDMDSLEKGGVGGKNYLIFSIFFAELIFAEGMKLKINIFLRFFLR